MRKKSRFASNKRFWLLLHSTSAFQVRRSRLRLLRPNQLDNRPSRGPPRGSNREKLFRRNQRTRTNPRRWTSTMSKWKRTTQILAILRSLPHRLRARTKKMTPQPTRLRLLGKALRSHHRPEGTYHLSTRSLQSQLPPPPPRGARPNPTMSYRTIGWAMSFNIHENILINIDGIVNI